MQQVFIVTVLFFMGCFVIMEIIPREIILRLSLSPSIITTIISGAVSTQITIGPKHAKTQINVFYIQIPGLSHSECCTQNKGKCKKAETSHIIIGLLTNIRKGNQSW